MSPILLVLAGLVLALSLVACSAPGKVTGFDDDVRRNFLDACKASDAPALAKSAAVCGCWFDAIKAAFTFDEFRQLERDMATPEPDVAAGARLDDLAGVLTASGCAAS